MVHFSGKARKMNHIPPSRASEASARSIVKVAIIYDELLTLNLV
ncbi:MAG: hypothetical protein U5L45_06065 [Saprospiraceae bacterium]|nr:hypothetical protein [Saprospiraceae bacterium]